uniref:Major facilitator superfamily (MFS) profile domain-containing protein n=1 Tax=Timema cristinae TaxID=61476 RepID=A0A7R9H6J1_TIMCR|nr:unnamed protein product [Timema cristinae]
MLVGNCGSIGECCGSSETSRACSNGVGGSVMFLVSAAVSCIVLYFATSWYLVLLLAFFFVCFIAVSSSLLNSSVVDIFPTRLRAMAVCLTLMAGRTGVVGGSLMIGALIDTHCSLAFVVLSGVSLSEYYVLLVYRL